MKRRLRLLVSLVFVVVLWLAAFRLGPEVLWFGAIVLLEAAATHLWASILVLAILCGLAFAGHVDRAPGGRGASSALSRGLVPLVAIVTGVLLFQTLSGGTFFILDGSGIYDWSRLSEPVREHVYLAGAALVLTALLWFAVLRRDLAGVAKLTFRVVVLLCCLTAWMLSLDVLLGGMVELGVQGSSLEAYVTLAGGVLMGVLGALSIRWVFALEAPRWAVVLATFCTTLGVLLQHALLFLPVG